MESENKQNRRFFLRSGLLSAATAPVLPSLFAPAPAKQPAIPPKKNALDQHRNLFNGDTCVYFYNPERWQPEDYTMKTVVNPRTGKMGTKPVAIGGPFQAKAIHRYVDLLADNGIDTFVINANANRAWYPSKKIPSILDGYKRGDREFFRGHAICQGITEPEAVEEFLDNFERFMNRYQDLLDAGVDWLAETAKACRRRKISPWVSIRMNDMHGSRNVDGSFFNLPLFKKDEMRLKHASYGLQNAQDRIGFNYEKPEVRALMFEQIREVVEDYDYEGLELDWWRQPLCCEPGASDQTIAMMNDWFRQIRELTQRRAKKTGKPYPFGMRIPGALDSLKAIGIDVVTLTQEGTLDFIIPAGFWATTWDMPHDEFRKRLGERVTIYGSVDDGANSLPTQNESGSVEQRMRYIGANPEVERANAAGKLAMGVHGIEWFNFFCSDQPLIPGLKADYTALRDIHKLDFLRGKPKHYCFSTAGAFFNPTPFELPAQLPASIGPFAQRPFQLAMCAEPADKNLELVVQVVLKAEDKPGFLPVSVNGCWPNLKNEKSQKLLTSCGSLTHLTKEHLGYNYRFPVSLLTDGWNKIVVENQSKETITVAAIEIGVLAKTV
ncbi:hypothetical protein [Larkinella terrae]|uniref:Family 10 glycosylhydrolase n=1 Tax=Larkinella terrae TaxID=2025311 RepID=A0A7K0EGB0_9BACT|nr:hypothetical protein [Larkinella terrae]MRS60890.1 hypothetical protein [Larkinella terrae]